MPPARKPKASLILPSGLHPTLDVIRAGGLRSRVNVYLTITPAKVKLRRALDSRAALDCPFGLRSRLGMILVTLGRPLTYFYINIKTKCPTCAQMNKNIYSNFFL